MIEAIAVWLSPIWFGYKWVTKKQFKYIVLPVLLIVLHLARWPFFLEYKLVFGLLNIIGGIMMGADFSIKKQITLVYPYIVILLGTGMIMLTYFFFGKH
jgi:hypothetical protein